MHKISFHFHLGAGFTHKFCAEHIYNTIDRRLGSLIKSLHPAIIKKKTLYKQKTMPPPRRPGLLSDSSQDVINRWFTHYNFSFSNPEDIAARLTSIKRRYKRRKPNRILPGNCDRLLGVLSEISLFFYHRHRRDAANIVSQVKERLKRGGTVEVLVPYPARYESLGFATSPLADD